MDYWCVLASILFFVGNLLFILYNVTEINGMGNMSSDGFKELDPALIKRFWASRTQAFSLEIAASLINASAWAIFSMPILQLAWILSLGGKRRVSLHISIALLVVAASLSEFLSLLLTVGMSNVTEWVGSTMNLTNWKLNADGSHDNVGWRILELCSLVFNGMVIWIETFEWFALSIALMLIYVSTCSLMNAGVVGGHQVSFTFGKCWAHLGLFIALLALIDFLSQVLRVVQWQYFAEIGLMLGIINRLMLFPVWLLCLGKQLTVATNSIEITKNFNLMQQHQQEQDSGMIEMGDTSNNDSDAPTINIPLSD